MEAKLADIYCFLSQKTNNITFLLENMVKIPVRTSAKRSTVRTSTIMSQYYVLGKLQNRLPMKNTIYNCNSKNFIEMK